MPPARPAFPTGTPGRDGVSAATVAPRAANRAALPVGAC